MMITAGFFVLLMVSVISANRMIIDSSTSIEQGDATNLSVDIARSVVSEAYKKKYDQNSVDSVYQSESTFTAPGSLGPEAGEQFTLPDVPPYQSYSRYNDLDDYNGYVRTVDAGSIKGFKVSVSVYYVDDTNFAKSNTRTSLKRIAVTVENPAYLKRTISYSSLATP